MPYIKKHDREYFDWWLERQPKVLGPGELNYVISKILDRHIIQHGEHYDTYNSLIGIIECAKLELYRRKIAIYEDKKIQENGDVY